MTREQDKVEQQANVARAKEEVQSLLKQHGDGLITAHELASGLGRAAFSIDSAVLAMGSWEL